MKRSTCKMLLGIGMIWLILVFLFTIFLIMNSPFYSIWVYLFTGIGLFGTPSWILFIIAIAKWNSEKEHEDVRKAQLQALRKGKANIELKSKVRKLK